MRKNLRWLVGILVVFGMGIAMPSCPGQQAMQQQIDTVQTSTSDFSKKIQILNAQVTTLNNDMAQIKPLLQQMTGVIQAQKTALETLDATVKSMQPKPRAAGKKRK